jgi:hypothetical protein
LSENYKNNVHREPTVNNLPNIIDIEASGFGYESYPIEVGVADDQGKRFCTLIEPDENWTFWDDGAEKVHNISRDNLLECGKRVVEVATMLNERYGGQTLYTDGWVVDKPWINTLFQTARIPMKFSVSPLEMILNEAQMAVWHDEKEKVINELQLTRHRASNDAHIIQETFRRTALSVLTTH